MRQGKSHLGMPLEIAICRVCDEKMNPSEEVISNQKRDQNAFAKKKLLKALPWIATVTFLYWFYETFIS
jgi:hypothetical protein